MQEPLVSICVPAYNVERFLGESLRSILGQSYPRTEVVLVDDASTDDTFAVARSFRDERLRLFRSPENAGDFRTMNKAVGLATGELVAIYHADDVYEPTIVEREVAFLQSHPDAAAVFAMIHFIDEHGGLYGGIDVPGELADRDLLRYEDLFPFLVRNRCIMLPTPTFMARRSALDQVGLFEPEHYGIAADVELWVRLARRHPIGIIDERLMRYRHGDWQCSRRWRHLRTQPDCELQVLEMYLDRDGWRERLDAAALEEFRFHRCDDETTRAANHVILGDGGRARELLRGVYPYRTLKNGVRRRKLRVLALRALMKAALAARADQPLARLLRWTEYGGRV